MIAWDLLQTHCEQPRAESAGFDPFADDDGLLESELMDFRFDASRSILGILIDLRLALAFESETEDTGVLVMSGVTNIAWNSERRNTNRTAWNIIGSELAQKEPTLSLHLSCYPDARLSVTADSLDYYACSVIGLPKHQPDYSDEEATVLQAIQTWDSDIELCGRISYHPQR